MAFALIAGLNGAGKTIQGLHTDAEQGAAAIGATLGVTFVLFLWVLGTIILGAMTMLTRGRRETITEERP